MALDTIIEVAELDDLGFRVVAPERRAHVERTALRPSRIFGIWGTALVAIALLGLVGRFFEPRRSGELQPEGPFVATIAEDAQPRAWPIDGHSAFRYPGGGRTTMTLHFTYVLGPDSSTTRLAVGGRIEGPVGNVAVQLVSGAKVYDEVTRFYSPLGGRPPAPFGAFDLSFDIPADTALGDLWIVARAYHDDHVVAVASAPVAPTWRLVGPDKYVIDDVVGPSVSLPRAGSPDGAPAGGGESSRGAPSASS